METGISVPVNADVAKFESKMLEAESRLKNFDKAVETFNKTLGNKWNQLATGVAVYTTALKNVAGAVQSYIISPLSGAVNAFVSFGDQFAKTSQRLGIGVEALGGIKFAAEQCGAGFDEAVDAVKTFQEQLGAARLGDAGAIGKLGAVGINAADFEGLSSDDQFLKLADHIQAVGDRAQQTRTAIELFGDAGFKLLPFFQEGSDGIRKLMEEGKSIGAVLGEDAANSAAALGDSMNRMKTSCANVSNLLMSNLAPAITSVMNGISAGIAAVCRMKSELGILVTVLGTYGLYAGLTAAIPLLISFTTRLWASAAAAGGLSSALKFLNPTTAGLTLASVAAVGLYEAFLKVNRASYEYSTEAEKQAEAFQKAADADKERIERLKELQALSETDTLNTSETEEAISLVGELAERYGDLGISIDQTTGKITGMTDAQQKFLEVMNAEKIRLAEQVLAEKGMNASNRKKELDALVAEDKAAQGKWTFWYNHLGGKKQYEQEITSAEEAWVKAVNEQNQAGYDLNMLEPKTTADLTAANKAARKEQEEAGKTLAERKLDTDLMDPLEKAFYDLAEKTAEKYRQLDDDIALAQKAGDAVKVSELQNRYEKIARWESEQRAAITNGVISSREGGGALKAVSFGDSRLAGARNAVENARSSHALAVLNGGDTAAAAEALKAAELELAKTVAAVSGADRRAAREELERLQKEYNESSGSTRLNALADRIAEAQKLAEDKDSEYYAAVGQVAASREVQVSEAVEAVSNNRFQRGQGTFSAYEAGQMQNPYEVRMMKFVASIEDICRRTLAKKESALT